MTALPIAVPKAVSAMGGCGERDDVASQRDTPETPRVAEATGTEEERSRSTGVAPHGKAEARTQRAARRAIIDIKWMPVKKVVTATPVELCATFARAAVSRRRSKRCRAVKTDAHGVPRQRERPEWRGARSYGVRCHSHGRTGNRCRRDQPRELRSQGQAGDQPAGDRQDICSARARAALDNRVRMG